MSKTRDEILKRFPNILVLIGVAKRSSRLKFDTRVAVVNRLYESLGNYIGWRSPDPEYNTSEVFDVIAHEFLRILRL